MCLSNGSPPVYDGASSPPYSPQPWLPLAARSWITTYFYKSEEKCAFSNGSPPVACEREGPTKWEG